MTIISCPEPINRYYSEARARGDYNFVMPKCTFGKGRFYDLCYEKTIKLCEASILPRLYKSVDWLREAHNNNTLRVRLSPKGGTNGLIVLRSGRDRLQFPYRWIRDIV